MSKIRFTDYTRKGGVVTIIITDEDGSKLDTFKYNRRDKRKEKSIAITINEKYNVNLSPEISVKDAEQFGFFDS